MEVVPTGVHGRFLDVVEVGVEHAFCGGIGEVCLLENGETVDIGAKEDRRAGPIAVDADEAGLAYVCFDLYGRAMLLVQGFEFVRDTGGSLCLEGADFWVAMEVFVEIFVALEVWEVLGD